MDTEWIVLTEAFGMPQAELLKSYLEARQIPTVLSQEALGSVIGLTVGPLSEVQVMVRAEQFQAANTAMEAFYQDTPADEFDESAPTSPPLAEI